MMKGKKPAKSKSVLTGASTFDQIVKAANRHRQQYNPLKGLTMKRAVGLLEAYVRGEFADVMWTLGNPALGIEVLDADLSALITRRTAAIKRMGWNVKTMDPKTKGFSQALADDQAGALRERYELLENLEEALDFFVLSTFRGFSVLEIQEHEGLRFAPVDHWNLVRDGLLGDWKYNPSGRSTSFTGLHDQDPLPLHRFLVRQSARPVGMIGLIKYVRSLNCEKNWDGFVDIFGIPGGVVTGPPDVPAEKEKEYEESAKLIAQGGSGYLPHGSQYTANDSPRGNDPFKPRLDHLSEKLVMAGTGGKLTMLAAATGIGSGPAEEQEKVFEDIARAEAKEINSILNRQFDAPKLQALFPGRPVLAYFELAYQEEDDVGEIVEHASKLSAAGYKIDPAQIQERTSYRLTDSVEPPDADPAGKKTPLKNRASQAVAESLGVPASWVAPIDALLSELEAKAADPDVSDQELIRLMQQAQAKAPELLGKMDIEALAEIFEAGMGDAALTGLRNALKNTL